MARVERTDSGLSSQSRGSFASMSERVSTMSMPGSFRRAKAKFTGHRQMDNDPLGPLRLEVTDLAEMMTMIETCGRTMQASIELLNTAPKMMLEKMRTFFPQDAPYGQLVMRFSSLEGQLGQRLESGQAHIEALHSLAATIREKTTTMAQEFKRRDEAYEASSHYDKKVDSLRSVLMQSGSGRLSEKVNRNEQKRCEAAQALQQISDETERSASAILARKLRDTGEAVAHVCRYYSSMFNAADGISKELSSLAEAFAHPSSAEDMLRKGREYASQAAERGKEFVSQAASGEYAQKAAAASAAARDKAAAASAAAREKASGFASGARERFSAAGAATSSKLQSNRESIKSPRGSHGSIPEEESKESAWGSSAEGWPPNSSTSWPSTAIGSGQSNGGGLGGAASPWGATSTSTSPQSPWDAPAPAASGNSSGYTGGGNQGGSPWGAPAASNISPWGGARR